MNATQSRPFSWVVRFTVDPTWVADGFCMTDERALSMLASEVSGAHGSELSAQVLHAPSALQIVRMQGYEKTDPRSRREIDALIESTPAAGVVHNALIAARDLLDSVAFVAKDGDTSPVLEKLKVALEAIDARQGEAVEVAA
jgi:hypothetical protein